jgi:hypothetical protein
MYNALLAIVHMAVLYSNSFDSLKVGGQPRGFALSQIALIYYIRPNLPSEAAFCCSALYEDAASALNCSS